MCGYVLIGYAYVGTQPAVSLAHAHRTHLRGENLGAYDHCPALGFEGIDRDRLLRHTVHLRRLLNDVDILFGAPAGYAAVVAHTHKQTSARTVGERRERACDLAGIADGVLEVLTLMLPFCYGACKKSLAAHGTDIFHCG